MSKELIKDTIKFYQQDFNGRQVMLNDKQAASST